ncbi:MAG: hypothetical protein AAGA41_07870 [Pseudomonadota bacterium]
MMFDRTNCEAGHEGERRGNVWSGIVAMVLLAMFTIALISSEIDATGDSARAPVATVIAGQ